jgi:outer membrane protein assembly factor BamD (BamD/ComL family)
MFKIMSRFCVIFVLAIFLISACGSSPINISYDLSPAELIQRAQEASDRNRYNTALQYYQALYDRNRSNIDLVITSEYEIAFIHYKQKKYRQSREEFNSLLEYYNSPDAELLPQQYKVLSNIVLQRIEEKENEKSFWSKIPLIKKLVN